MNTGIWRVEAARSIFSVVETLFGWLAFWVRLVLGCGFVQFGEFVDSIAEFVLDVADTVLDGYQFWP
jgi:hypothetical protein